MIVAPCALPEERRRLLELLAREGIPMRVSERRGDIDDLLLVHGPQLVRHLRRFGALETALCSLGAAKEALSLDSPTVLLAARSLWAGANSARPESPVNLHAYVARLFGGVTALVVVLDKHFPRGTLEFAGGGIHVAALYSASEGVKARFMGRNANVLLMPMPPGIADPSFSKYVDVLGEYVDALNPDITIIGLGTDVHYRDIHGEHFVSEWGYASLTSRLGGRRRLVTVECASPGAHTVSIISSVLDALSGRAGVGTPRPHEESDAVREESSRILRLVRRMVRERRGLD